MSNKLREALKKCMELGEKIDESLGTDESTVWNCRYERSFANSIVEIAKEALAEPLRNCDIGTVAEQKERFDKYCFSRKCYECPVYFQNQKSVDCGLWWAQMQYDGS